MLLAIDAGNTNTVFALSDGQEILHVWRCRTDAARTADEYVSWLFPLFVRAGLDFSIVGDVIVGSVVPDANFNIRKLCADIFGCEPLVVGAEQTGLKINLPRPEEAGADRLVNACAVIRDYGCPAIVVDLGTATTFDVINAQGEYCGGAIAPGINLSMTALHQAAARLPRVSIARPPSIVGTTTVNAMQSGIFWGYVGLIEGMLNRIIAETGEKPRIVATGGLAGLLSDAVPLIETVDKDLTLRGLLYIYQGNRQRKAA
jgi:type III pantothenate kinase